MRIDNGRRADAFGPDTITRQSGLTKEQQRYCEAKGYLGAVERATDGTRVYSPTQAEFFMTFGALRRGHIRVDEAAALASERIGGLPRISEAQLERLARRAMEDLEERLATALAVTQLLRARTAAPVRP